jgi:hypothetical protein
MRAKLPIEVDPGIMSHAPLSRGTPGPVQSRFEHLVDNLSLEESLECFPTGARGNAFATLRHIKREVLVKE